MMCPSQCRRYPVCPSNLWIQLRTFATFALMSSSVLLIRNQTISSLQPQRHSSVSANELAFMCAAQEPTICLHAVQSSPQDMSASHAS